MARPALDLEGLHYVMWTMADDGLLRLSQVQFAGELGVSKHVLNRTFAELERQGRIRDVTGSPGAKSKLYEIVDPADLVDVG